MQCLQNYSKESCRGLCGYEQLLSTHKPYIAIGVLFPGLTVSATLSIMPSWITRRKYMYDIELKHVVQ